VGEIAAWVAVAEPNPATNSAPNPAMAALLKYFMVPTSIPATPFGRCADSAATVMRYPPPLSPAFR
jgi:hypothetical protein